MTQYIWIGTGAGGDGTSWSDPKNWQTGDQVAQSAPGPGDDVTIGVAGLVIMDTEGAENLTVFSGFDVDGGDLTTTQFFDVDGGEVSISGGGQISVSNESGATAYLEVNGSIDVDGSGSALDGSGSGGAIVGGVGGAGGSLTIEAGASADFETSSSTGASLSIGDGVDGLVLVEGNGSSLTASGVDVGVGGSGGLTIEDGASANFTALMSAASSLTIGAGGDLNGNVIVDGIGSTLTATGVIVGDAGGLGYLEVDDGGAANFSNPDDEYPGLAIGYQGGSGIVTVDGGGSSLTVSNSNTLVGSSGGTGSLTIQNGASGTFTSDPGGNALDIGSGGAGGTGTVTVTGSGSTLTASGGAVLVGDTAAGSLTVSAAATLDANYATDSLDIGDGAGVTGTVDVTGSGSTLSAAGPIIVGDAGMGALIIADSASLQSSVTANPSVDLGNQATGAGTMTVTDSGTNLVLDQGEGIFIGDDGSGTFDVENGATVNVATTDPTNYWAAVFGYNTTGSGTLVVNGPGSVFTAGAGGMSVGYAGSGSVTVSDGATLDVTDATYGLDIGTQEDSNGTLDITGQGSTLDADGPINDGDAGAGVFEVLDGATNTVGSDITLGAQDTGDGTLDVMGENSALTVGGTLTVGQDGAGTVTVDATDSAELTTYALMSAEGIKATASINLGSGNGSQAFVTVQNATTIAQQGTATLTLNGGGDGNVGLTTSSLMMGSDAGSKASLDIGANQGGNAILNVAGTTTIGGDGNANVTLGGMGLGDSSELTTAVLMSGAGLQSVASISIGKTGSTGTVDLTVSGDMTIAGEGESTVDMLSGTGAVGGDLTLGQAEGSEGTLSLSGNGTTFDANGGDATIGDDGTGELDVDNKADVQIAGDLDLADGDGSTGTLTVDSASTLDVTGDLDEAIGLGSTSTTTFGGSGGSSGDPHIHGDYIIGDAGATTDNIMAGVTTIVDGAITIGRQSTGVGSVTVSGADALLTAGVSPVTIGDAGSGTLVVAMGGEVDAANVAVTIADQGGSTGVVTVQDDDSSLSAGTLTVGADGSGGLTIKDGGSVSVGGDASLGDGDAGDGTVTLSGDGSGLSVGSGLTIGDAGTGVLTVDEADLSVGGAITVGVLAGGSGTFTLNGAVADLEDAVTVGDAGNGLVIVQQGASASFDSIVIGNSNGGIGELDVDDATAASNDITVGSSGGGTLKLTDSATLNTNADATVGEYVSGNVETATVDSQSIWAINGGLTIGDSGIATTTIEGEGQIGVTGDVVLGGQTAASGTLTVTGQNDGAASNLAYGATLTVGEKGDGSLNIDAGAYVSPGKVGSGQIDIAADAGSKGMVTVDGAGSLLSGTDLWVGGAQSGPSGTGAISLSNGGEVSVSNSTVWGGSSIEGAGTVNGAVKDDGSVTASGGALEITGAVGGTGVLAIDAGASLQLDGAVAGGVTVDFDPAVSETLVVNDLTANAGGPPQNFNATIENFQAGDVIAFAASGLGGAPAITDATPGAFDSGDNTTSVVLADGGDAIATLLFEGDYSGSTFTVTPSGDDFALTEPPCYCAGTHVLTDKGEITVENLAIGDVVITARGERRPIVWLGHRKVDIAKYYSPESVRPIRVKAGALGDKVPSRDLRLSPDHALFIDGLLIQAGALVNGTSIVRETTVPREFVYYHIELEEHSLILAENTPTETFVDNVHRLGFDNWAEHEALYPDGKAIEEMPYPRAKGRRQVPMHIRAALDARAIAICPEEVSAVA